MATDWSCGMPKLSWLDNCILLRSWGIPEKKCVWRHCWCWLWLEQTSLSHLCFAHELHQRTSATLQLENALITVHVAMPWALEANGSPIPILFLCIVLSALQTTATSLASASSALSGSQLQTSTTHDPCPSEAFHIASFFHNSRWNECRTNSRQSHFSGARSLLRFACGTTANQPWSFQSPQWFTLLPSDSSISIAQFRLSQIKNGCGGRAGHFICLASRVSSALGRLCQSDASVSPDLPWQRTEEWKSKSRTRKGQIKGPSPAKSLRGFRPAWEPLTASHLAGVQSGY